MYRTGPVFVRHGHESVSVSRFHSLARGLTIALDIIAVMLILVLVLVLVSPVLDKSYSLI